MAIYLEVANRLNYFEQERQRIEGNKMLSGEGKKRALEQLKEQAGSYKGDALRILKAEWDDISRKYDERAEDYEYLQRKESDRWNYPKLAHEREMLKAELSKARDEQTLEAVFKEHSNSGIPERKLALAELAGEHAERLKAGGIKVKAEKMLAELRDTPELKEHRQAGSAFVKKAIDLMKVTQDAQEYYAQSEGESLFFGGTGSFTALMGNLKIKTHPDAQTLRTDFELVKE